MAIFRWVSPSGTALVPLFFRRVILDHRPVDCFVLDSEIKGILGVCASQFNG